MTSGGITRVVPQNTNTSGRANDDGFRVKIAGYFHLRYKLIEFLILEL